MATSLGEKVNSERGLILAIANPLIADGQAPFLKKANVIITNSTILLKILDRCIISVRQGIYFVQNKAKALMNKLQAKLTFACIGFD
jgi:hypothetical protein